MNSKNEFKKLEKKRGKGMATLSRDELVDMAYAYLVEGKIQATIEAEMGLKQGTVSRELRPFGITGSANNAGRGGWGAKGNHCGIASYQRLGVVVTRQDVYDFMFGSGRNMSDYEYFGNIARQKGGNQQSAPVRQPKPVRQATTNPKDFFDNDFIAEPAFSGGSTANSSGGSEIVAGIVGIIILIVIFKWLSGIGFFAKLGAIVLFILKLLVAAMEGSFSFVFGRDALADGKYITLILVALFTIWGVAVMFFGDGLLWGAGIWAIGLIIGYFRTMF